MIIFDEGNSSRQSGGKTAHGKYDTSQIGAAQES